MSRPALGSKLSAIQWVTDGHFLGVIKTGREANHSAPSIATVKNSLSYLHHFPTQLNDKVQYKLRHFVFNCLLRSVNFEICDYHPTTVRRWPDSGYLMDHLFTANLLLSTLRGHRWGSTALFSFNLGTTWRWVVTSCAGRFNPAERTPGPVPTEYDAGRTLQPAFMVSG